MKLLFVDGILPMARRSACGLALEYSPALSSSDSFLHCSIILGDPLREWRNMRVSVETKQRRLVGLEGEIAGLTATGSDQTRTIGDLTKENSNQDETIKTSRARIESLLHQLGEEHNKKNSLLLDLQDMKMRVERLEHELQSMRREKELMHEEKNEELRTVRSEMNVMQITKNDELKVARREKDSMQVQRDEAQDKVKVMAKRLAFVTSKIAEQQVDLASEYQPGNLMEGL
jgi:chromosome segregation ATPase